MSTTTRRERTRLSPTLDRLETRTAPGTMQPTVLDQVFLERINDHRATLRGINARPFALLPSLDTFAAMAAKTRNGNGLKNAMDRAGIPWDRRNSFTAGVFHSGFAQPVGSDPAQLTSVAEQLAFFATVGPSSGPWPLIGRPGNALYRAHRVVGLDITANGRDVTYRDITVAYRGKTPLVTGVVYRDANGNGKYDAGEGLSGVTVSAGPLGTARAWDTGGYTLPINTKRPATVTVEASGGGLAAPIAETVTVQPGANSRLNFVVA